jgi:transcriptional regulator with GAF, ATPase, and Fis domain
VGDVPLLVQFLVSKFAARIGARIDSIGKRTMERLERYRWPGNIREMENILGRAIILSQGSTLEIEDDVFASAASAPTSASTAIGLQELQRDHIIAALKQTNWVIEGPTGAATILKIHPNTLRSRLKKLGITKQISSSHDAS